MMGNLTRDPEYKQLPSGQALCKLGLASNRQFKNRQTDTVIQEVCFIDVDVWGAQAESCRQYLQKGRPVLVEGRLKFDTWQDNNGQTRSKHSIVADRVLFLSATQSEAVETAEQQASQSKATSGKQDEATVKLEKELLDQIEEIKARADVKQAKKEVAPKKEAAPKKEEQPAEGVAFKDEPPFQDDLPF